MGLTSDKREQLRVGVVGIGRMGAQHARNLSGTVAGAKLVAIADPDEAAGKRLGEQLGLDAVYTDYKDLIGRDDIDAVVIAAPADKREEMVSACVEAGKHIFCEKPVAQDLDSARRIRRVVEKGSVLYQLGFMRRFDPAYVHAFRRIRDGVIGKPIFIRLTSRDASGPPVQFLRDSGGLFVDSSVHDFDLARWLMDDEVVSVYALGGNFVYPEYADVGDVDVGTATLSFAGGGIGLHDNARHSGYGYDIRTEVLGTEGAIQIGYLNSDSVVLLKRGQGNYAYIPDFLERFADAYRSEMQHFVDCVREGRQPAVGIEDGERALQIASAAQASLRSQRPEPVVTQQTAKAAGD